MPSRTEKDLADYLYNAVDNNYLVSLIITSHTQGKVKSQNMPFGLGKTTLAWWSNYYLNDKNWDLTFASSAYNPYAVVCLVDPKLRQEQGRLNAITYDDIQATAPSQQGVPRAIRRLANYLTINRPEVACIIGTADNINNISSPLRKLFLFELIVAERGVYEVQKIRYFKNFKNPLKDLGTLDYIEEGTFSKLPPKIQKRYDQWRVQQKMLMYPALKQEIMAYAKLQEWTTEDLESGVVKVHASVVRAGHGYMIHLPDDLGEKLHRREVEVVIKT